jgi:hypothetical protein
MIRAGGKGPFPTLEGPAVGLAGGSRRSSRCLFFPSLKITWSCAITSSAMPQTLSPRRTYQLSPAASFSMSA